MASLIPDNISRKTTVDKYENEQLILKMLQEYYPDIALGPGTPIYEMVIRPMAFLWSKHSEGIKELYLANSLAYPTYMSTDDMDRIMTRYFETRKVGTTVYGIVRIIFKVARNYSILKGTIFQASNNRTYQTTTDTYLTASQMSGDTQSGYIVDIEVESTGIGNKYNAKANESVKVPDELSPYVLSAYFPASTSDGGIVEDNKAFYDRVKNNVSLKNLTTYRGARAELRDKLNITDAVTVGIKDSEMRRDLFELPSETGVFTVHRGSLADIYIRNDPYVVVTGFQSPLGFPYSFNGISVVDNPASLMTAWNAMNFQGINRNIRGTIYETLPIPASTQMSTLTSSIREVQDYVSNVNNEAIHSDNLVKQMWPIVVRFDLKISDTSMSTIAKTAVVSYVNNLKSGEYPQADNVIKALKDAGVLHVQTPIYMEAYYLKENLIMEKFGMNLVRNPSDSLLVPSETDSLKFTVSVQSQISIRTCMFYTNPDLVNITGI